MISFQRNRSAQAGKEGSFLQKRKKELQTNGSGIGEDFSAFLHQSGKTLESEPAYSQTGITDNTESEKVPTGAQKQDVQIETQIESAGRTMPENKPEPPKTFEKDGGATEDTKKKNIIRKTIAIEEDVFMQLQLLKAYHRLDHQDVIAIAVKEFLKRHTIDGHIKDSDLNAVMRMVKELRI